MEGFFKSANKTIYFSSLTSSKSASTTSSLASALSSELPSAPAFSCAFWANTCAFSLRF
jgi:hypothetical protein